jgi:hypothetical protein
MASPLRMPWGSESRLMMTMAPKQNAAITNITVDVISMQQLKPPIVTYAIAKAIMLLFAVCASSQIEKIRSSIVSSRRGMRQRLWKIGFVIRLNRFPVEVITLREMRP